jgi:Zn-dependent protease with chaperone function
MVGLVYKQRSSSSFKDFARETIDWCKKVIRSHLQSKLYVDTIFSFCKFWFFFTQILYHFHLLLSFWLEWFNSVGNFETKSTRIQSRLKMVLWPLIGLDDLFWGWQISQRLKAWSIAQRCEQQMNIFLPRSESNAAQCVTSGHKKWLSAEETPTKLGDHHTTQ